MLAREGLTATAAAADQQNYAVGVSTIAGGAQANSI
jgi:hypothetical protein